MSELKPCHHCKGRARLVTFKRRIGRVCPHTVFRQHVTCTKCGAQTKVFKSPGKAELAWNTRADDAEIESLREALRSVREWFAGIAHNEHGGELTAVELVGAARAMALIDTTLGDTK